MTGLKIVVNLVGLLVVMPIWYYLIYKILVAVQATELMWFLFWIYIPAGLFIRMCDLVIEKTKA
jgi:hypothetical protein